MASIPLAFTAFSVRGDANGVLAPVNMYASSEQRPNGVTLRLRSAPGLSQFADSGTSAPVRGLHNVRGSLFGVIGAGLYRIPSSTTFEYLGSIPGSGPVTMADNGAYIVVCDGNDLYTFKMFRSEYAKVTDADFLGAGTVAQIDGYFVWNVPGSDQFQVSALNDPLSISALDFATAERQPDRLVRVIADQGQLWLFGETTVEVWNNVGAGSPPFQRAYTRSEGCASPHSVAQLDNTLFWLGTDGMVYRENGYNPQVVPGEAVYQAFETYTLTNARAFAYTQSGHKFYVLTFPSDEATWVFDVVTGLWHRRATQNLGAWRPTAHAFCYGKNLVGGEDGKIYEMKTTHYADGPDELVRTFYVDMVRNDKRQITFNRLEIDADTGVGLITGQGSDPQAMMRFTDDRARTWSNELWRSVGQIGEYNNRVVWRQTGQSEQRLYKVAFSDPVPWTVHGAYLEGETNAH